MLACLRRDLHIAFEKKVPFIIKQKGTVLSASLNSWETHYDNGK